jgi:ketosteroid isomerase-like protein
MSTALIEQFYTAFSRKDAAAMGACYAPDATFSDPVFRDLKGAQVPAMWRMLCERGADLQVTHRDVRGDDASATAHWDAAYTFSQTGRKVQNAIDARFTFKDGKIATHVDSFDLWNWTRMALGTPGVVLGWSPMVQNKVRDQAMKGHRLG